MARFALIGKTLEHSFSKNYFENNFQINHHEFINYPTNNLDELRHGFKKLSIGGFNVTIPYKESIIPILDELNPDAESIGAVNCVTVNNNVWTGHNTDWLGFKKSLELLLQNFHRRALVLGTGGASKAIAYALAQLDIEYQFVSRGEGSNLSYNQLNNCIANFHLIINTTPLGTFPKVETFPPIPYAEIAPNTICFDLVYNPDKSEFLNRCEKQGAIIKNGYDMLRFQAEASWKLWGIK
jgi:shikimate dehydrogenase